MVNIITGMIIETNKNIILKYRDDFEKTLEVNNAKVKRLEDAKN